jgi:ABC-2 type transport system ATP-binding protein
MIHVKGLTKLYGNKTAVKEVSFDINKGAVAGLLGPNGAGKSTIMKMLTGYLAPDTGEITVDGIDVILDYRSSAVRTGYAPEIPPLFPEMTVEAYMLFAADLKGIKKTDRAKHISAIMEMAGVADVRGRLLKNLSKGYRQRVGVAQALIGFPPVLILDEPTAGLDPTQISQFRELLRSLAGNHTIILSSHILSEISDLCEEIIIINNGKLAAQESIKTSVSGQNVFLLTIKTTGSEYALNSVRAVKGIIEAEPVSSDDESVKIKVRFPSGKDNALETRTALFFALSAAELPILELVREKESLEVIKSCSAPFLLSSAKILMVRAGKRINEKLRKRSKVPARSPFAPRRL